MSEQKPPVKLNTYSNQPIEPFLPAITWIICFYIPTILMSLAFVMYAEQSPDITDIDVWFKDGDTTSAFTILMALITVPLLIVATSKAKVGHRLLFLGLSRVFRGKEFKPWLLISSLYFLLSYWINYEMQFETPIWMHNLVVTTDYLLLSIFAICAVAPVLEELVFRGFIYSKLARTVVGKSGAVMITALLFTALHTQYSIWIQLDLLVLAIILSLVRYKTDNLKYCIVIHCLNNSFAFYMLYL